MVGLYKAAFVIVLVFLLQGCGDKVTADVVSEPEKTVYDEIFNPGDDDKDENKIDSRCFEKVEASRNCDKIVAGWEYDRETNKCLYKVFSYGCEDSGKPFSSEERCREVCVLNWGNVYKVVDI